LEKIILAAAIPALFGVIGRAQAPLACSHHRQPKGWTPNKTPNKFLPPGLRDGYV
jgi:hypothetical protein